MGKCIGIGRLLGHKWTTSRMQGFGDYTMTASKHLNTYVNIVISNKNHRQMKQKSSWYTHTKEV